MSAEVMIVAFAVYYFDVLAKLLLYENNSYHLRTEIMYFAPGYCQTYCFEGA